MDRLLSMRVFLTVADTGGFAAAARALDMSAAGVTRLVADLENHVGARLLQRTTRRMSLTDAGQAYLSRVRHILEDVDEATRVVQAQTSDMAGTLRLMASPALAVHVLAPLGAEFRRLYPQVTVEIHVDASVDPPIGDHDITLMGADASFNANVIARPMVSTDAVLCASPEYLRLRGVPGTPQELSAHDCLLWLRPGDWRGGWRLFQPGQEVLTVEVALEPVFTANHTETLLRAALEGAGVSAQPTNLIAPYLCSGQLVRVLAPWITQRYTLYAALPSRKFMPARTRAFLEFMSERMRASVREVHQAGALAPV